MMIVSKWCTIDSKISFTPKVGRFGEENFLRYLGLSMLCYKPAYHILIEDLPSIIGCEPIRNFKKLFLQYLPTLVVKGILQLLLP